MSKVISFRDLLKFPDLKGFREIDLLHPSMDETIEPFIYALGIDTREPVEYVVNNHRDMSNKTGIGIRVVGEIRRDIGYTNSPLCDLVDRIVVAGIRDKSLGEDMEQLTRQVSNIQSLAEQEGVAMQELVEDDYLDSLGQIEALQGLITIVRGSNVINYNVS